MEIRHGVQRLADFGRALRMGRRELAGTARLGADQLRERQHRMLQGPGPPRPSGVAVVPGLVSQRRPERFELADLPTVAKPQLMDRFDDWVTDPALDLAGVERHLAGLAGDGLYLGRYRIVASSGSTGRRGVFVYSRRDWVANLANFGRLNEQFVGIHPRLPPRLRVAAVSATDPLHISARTGISMAVGVNRVARLDPRRPLAEVAAELQGFRPEVLVGYPSALALLAGEQLAARLNVSPRTVVTVSEVRTPEMEEAIRGAWGADPFDWYGITEGGVLAGDCRHHRGMHLFEDLFIVENVDEHGRAVPDGEVGHRLLITNLFNRTQPLIRYELSDMVAIESGPCACGHGLRRVVALEGRSDDILHLPGARGGRVAVHPVTLRSPFTQMAGVRQYRVVVEPDGLGVLLVLQDGVDHAEMVRRVGDALSATLARTGARPPHLHVEVVETPDRDRGHGAKFKLVDARVDATASREP